MAEPAKGRRERESLMASAWIWRPEKRAEGRQEETDFRRAERLAWEGGLGRRSMERKRRNAAA